MPKVQKYTPAKRANKKEDDKRKPRKSTEVESTPFAKAVGSRIRQRMAELRAANGKPWTNGELARRLQARRNLESPPTRSVGCYLNGERLPAAEELLHLAQALGVSAQWLLDGEGPKTREQVNASQSLDAALAEFLRREMSARLLGATKSTVLPEDFDIDGEAVLSALSADISDRARSIADDAHERGERFRSATSRLSFTLSTEKAIIKMKEGALAAAEWERNRDARIEREVAQLAQRHFESSSVKDDRLRLTRRARARLEDGAAPVARPFAGKYPDFIPLAAGLYKKPE